MTKSEYLCRQERHRNRRATAPDGYGHDAFISYRVASEAAFATLLCSLLQERGLCVFLDQRCLDDGLPWQEGFEMGIEDAKTILFLISARSLHIMAENIANGWHDNVLIEMRKGIQLSRERPAVRIVPILMGAYTENGLLEELSFANPAVKAITGDAADTLKDLFKDNGFQAHPRDPEMIVNRLISGNVLSPPQSFISQTISSDDSEIAKLRILGNGSLFRLDVSGKMQWCSNAKHSLTDSGKWQPLNSPKGSHIIDADAGAKDGALWCVSRHGVVFRSRLPQAGNSSDLNWERVPEVYLTHISCQSYDSAMGINEDSSVFQYLGSDHGTDKLRGENRWVQLKGQSAEQCTMGQDGTMWILTDRRRLYQWNGEFWAVFIIPTSMNQLSVHSAKRAAGVTKNHVIQILDVGSDSWVTYPAVGTRVTISENDLYYVNDDGELRCADLKEYFESLEAQTKENGTGLERWIKSSQEETEKDIRDGKAVFWRLTGKNKPFPDDAIVCGHVNEKDLFGMRVYFTNGILVGTATRDGDAWGTFDGNAIKFAAQYQILCGDGSQITWKDNAASLTKGALNCGYDNYLRKPTQLGRIQSGRNLMVGKASNGVIWYSHGANEARNEGGEIACYDMLEISAYHQWVQTAKKESKLAIETGNAVVWKFIKDHHHILDDAIVCGKDLDGSKMYAARTFMNGEVFVGRVTKNVKACSSYAGNVLFFADQYQVLCHNNKNDNTISWVQVNNRSAESRLDTSKIIVAGTDGNYKIGIGRVQHEGTLQVGKVNLSYFSMWFPYGKCENEEVTYELATVL
ncbi:hypothetical protein HK100_001522 [Physocladia obscura]|uniref:TIR domain-containing protein n=1 Tax=Physocladia obscura TaxID=109957 RepID=A0AAD5SX15_9FUNG|nr:hypothetical protein HK100_001522 [Physocladia obscura]